MFSSTIGGGSGNTIREFLSAGFGGCTIGGGSGNSIENTSFATIGGGFGNEAYGHAATVSGGSQNTNRGDFATIPGGEMNTTFGQWSFAAGRRAKAIHDGTFVWADSQGADFASTAANQFCIRAAGGVGINRAPVATLHVQSPRATAIDNTASFVNTNLGPNASHIQYGITGDWYIRSATNSGKVILQDSGGNVGIGTSSPGEKLHVVGNIFATGSITPNSDRNAKTGFAPVDAAVILEKVVALPITSWRFKAEPEFVRHVGPVAQDFQAAFALGEHPTAITTVDADGVALAAIQGLNQKLEDRSKILEAELKRRDAENAELKARLTVLEKLITSLSSKGD